MVHSEQDIDEYPQINAENDALIVTKHVETFVIAIVSTKGGSGRTTLAATLAVILAEQGLPVSLIECDPQQALPRHFDLSHDTPGWASAWLAGQPIAALQAVPARCNILPFGPLSAADHVALAHAAGEREVVPALVASVARGQGGIVLIDTPAGHHPLTLQALRAADAALAIWLCDPASREAYDHGGLPLPDGMPCAHVINQINATRQVRKAILREWRQLLGERLLPVPVHQDESVPEALQARMTVVQHAQYSQAAHDFQGIAGWLREQWLKRGASV